MGKALDEMYDNWICMNPRPIKPEYAKYMKTVSDTEAKLLEMLNGEVKALFEEFSRANGDLNLETARENFSQGVALGALLMQEILEIKTEIFGE